MADLSELVIGVSLDWIGQALSNYLTTVKNQNIDLTDIA